MKKSHILLYGVFLILSCTYWYFSGKTSGRKEYSEMFQSTLDSIQHEANIHDMKIDNAIKDTREYILQLDVNKDAEEFANHSQIK